MSDAMHTDTKTLKVGDRVRCLAGNIDRRLGGGEVGYVTGFARLSSYHPREAYVSDRPRDEGSPAATWCGWFWVSSLEAAPTERARGDAQ